MGKKALVKAILPDWLARLASSRREKKHAHKSRRDAAQSEGAAGGGKGGYCPSVLQGDGAPLAQVPAPTPPACTATTDQQSLVHSESQGQGLQTAATCQQPCPADTHWQSNPSTIGSSAMDSLPLPDASQLLTSASLTADESCSVLGPWVPDVQGPQAACPYAAPKSTASQQGMSNSTSFVFNQANLLFNSGDSLNNITTPTCLFTTPVNCLAPSSCSTSPTPASPCTANHTPQPPAPRDGVQAAEIKPGVRSEAPSAQPVSWGSLSIETGMQSPPDPADKFNDLGSSTWSQQQVLNRAPSKSLPLPAINQTWSSCSAAMEPFLSLPITRLSVTHHTARSPSPPQLALRQPNKSLDGPQGRPPRPDARSTTPPLPAALSASNSGSRPGSSTHSNNAFFYQPSHTPDPIPTQTSLPIKSRFGSQSSRLRPSPTKSHFPEIQMVWPLCLSHQHSTNLAVKLSIPPHVGNSAEHDVVRAVMPHDSCPPSLNTSPDNLASPFSAHAKVHVKVMVDDTPVADLKWKAELQGAGGRVPPLKTQHTSSPNSLGVATAFALADKSWGSNSHRISSTAAALASQEHVPPPPRASETDTCVPGPAVSVLCVPADVSEELHLTFAMLVDAQVAEEEAQLMSAMRPPSLRELRGSTTAASSFPGQVSSVFASGSTAGYGPASTSCTSAYLDSHQASGAHTAYSRQASSTYDTAYLLDGVFASTASQAHPCQPGHPDMHPPAAGSAHLLPVIPAPRKPAWLANASNRSGRKDSNGSFHACDSGVSSKVGAGLGASTRVSGTESSVPASPPRSSSPIPVGGRHSRQQELDVHDEIGQLVYGQACCPPWHMSPQVSRAASQVWTRHLLPLTRDLAYLVLCVPSVFDHQRLSTCGQRSSEALQTTWDRRTYCSALARIVALLETHHMWHTLSCILGHASDHGVVLKCRGEPLARRDITPDNMRAVLGSARHEEVTVSYQFSTSKSVPQPVVCPGNQRSPPHVRSSANDARSMAGLVRLSAPVARSMVEGDMDYHVRDSPVDDTLDEAMALAAALGESHDSAAARHALQAGTPSHRVRRASLSALVAAGTNAALSSLHLVSITGTTKAHSSMTAASSGHHQKSPSQMSNSLSRNSVSVSPAESYLNTNSACWPVLTGQIPSQSTYMSAAGQTHSPVIRSVDDSDDVDGTGILDSTSALLRKLEMGTKQSKGRASLEGHATDNRMTCAEYMYNVGSAAPGGRQVAASAPNTPGNHPSTPVARQRALGNQVNPSWPQPFTVGACSQAGLHQTDSDCSSSSEAPAAVARIQLKTSGQGLTGRSSHQGQRVTGQSLLLPTPATLQHLSGVDPQQWHTRMLLEQLLLISLCMAIVLSMYL